MIGKVLWVLRVYMDSIRRQFQNKAQIPTQLIHFFLNLNMTLRYTGFSSQHKTLPAPTYHHKTFVFALISHVIHTMHFPYSVPTCVLALI